MKIEVEVADLLAVRDALVTDDPQEAYRRLYVMADPSYGPGGWKEWERLAPLSDKRTGDGDV